MTRFTLCMAALYGGMAVCLGAFGAHAMKARLSPEMLTIWHTAEQYQFYHALALLGVGLAMRQGLTGTAPTLAAGGFIVGTAIFSGSLYLLAATGVRVLGAVTPIGGVFLILGWITLLWVFWRAL